MYTAINIICSVRNKQDSTQRYRNFYFASVTFIIAMFSHENLQIFVGEHCDNEGYACKVKIAVPLSSCCLLSTLFLCADKDVTSQTRTGRCGSSFLLLDHIVVHFSMYYSVVEEQKRDAAPSVRVWLVSYQESAWRSPPDRECLDPFVCQVGIQGIRGIRGSQRRSIIV